MARQHFKYLTMSAVAIALTSLLSACGGSDHDKSKLTKPTEMHFKNTAPIKLVAQKPQAKALPIKLLVKQPQPKTTTIHIKKRTPIKLLVQHPQAQHTTIHFKNTAPIKLVAKSTVNNTQATSHFTLPNDHFIFVVDANKAALANAGQNAYTLTIPMNKISQVAEFVFTQNKAPTYMTGQQAQQLWNSSAQNIFAGEHAILSAKYHSPHALLITGESVKNNTVIFDIQSNKPLHGYQLSHVVLNIRGQN